MGKKTYHIVDPGTGRVVEEKDYGLFSRFLFWSASTKGRITLWIALGAIVLLCLTLSALAPSLPGVPASVLSVARDIPFCVAVLVPLRFALRFVAGLGRKKPEPEPEQEYYHIVDPGTGAVVDRIRNWQSTQKQQKPKQTGLWDKLNTAAFWGWLASGVFLILCYFLKDTPEPLPSFVFYTFLVLCIGSAVLAHVSSYFMKKADRSEDRADRET